MARFKYTPEKITNVLPHEVFVFGSNVEGIHGAGSARTALHLGAIYGCPMGMSPNQKTYGIVTKDLRQDDLYDSDYKSMMLKFIQSQVICLYRFAEFNYDKDFYVTKIGTNLAGFSLDDIVAIFHLLESIRPDNVIIPKEFSI